MAKLEYFVVSESVAVDRETNRTSIFNVLEEVRLDAGPQATQNARVVAIGDIVATGLLRSEVGDEDKDWQAILKVKAPDGNTQEVPVNFRFLEGTIRHRLIVRVTGYPFTTFGDIVVELLLNGQHLAEHVISVLPKQPPA